SVPSLEFQEQLAIFFYDLVNHNHVRSSILAYELIQPVLDAADPSWIHLWNEIPDLAIATESFWKYDAERPWSFVGAAIRLLAPKIRAVHLEDIPLQNEHAVCFKDCNYINH